MMKKTFLKILFIILIIYNINISYWYKSNELINLYYTWSSNYTNIYNVPIWKDLIINNVKSDSIDNYIYIKDSNSTNILWVLNWGIDYNDNLIIKNSLELKTNYTNNNDPITSVFSNINSTSTEINNALSYINNLWDTNWLNQKACTDFRTDINISLLSSWQYSINTNQWTLQYNWITNDCINAINNVVWLSNVIDSNNVNNIALDVSNTANLEKIILLNWYLVNEDEDIQYYIQWDSNAWNKHIFNKEDIDFIYFREFIFFIFLMIIKFFEFIIWRKLLMK